MSSFIFQLPLQLMFFECHSAEAEEEVGTNLQQISPSSMDVTDSAISLPIQEVATDTDIETEHQSVDNAVSVTNPASNPNGADLCMSLEEGRTSRKEGTSSSEDHRKWYSLVYVENISNARLWLKICNKVIRNPVLLGKYKKLLTGLATCLRLVSNLATQHDDAHFLYSSRYIIGTSLEPLYCRKISELS